MGAVGDGARRGVVESDREVAEDAEQATVPRAINTAPALSRSLLTLALLGSWDAFRDRGVYSRSEIAIR
jgi:hypothetical protein